MALRLPVRRPLSGVPQGRPQQGRYKYKGQPGLRPLSPPSPSKRKRLRRSLRHMKRSELIDIIEEMQNPGAVQPEREEIRQEKSRLAYRSQFRKALRTTLATLIVVAAVAVLISAIFFPVLQVSGHSMAPTLLEGDVVLVRKYSSPQRGELCTFYYQNHLLIKRVIGLPGDEVYIDEEGRVFVNGQLLDEPYVNELALGEGEVPFPYQVPENRYFVLGDHRQDSIDSRYEMIGSIGTDQMVGRILLRIWPLERLAKVY